MPHTTNDEYVMSPTPGQPSDKYVVQLPPTGGEYVMDHWVDQVPEQRHFHYTFSDALEHLLAANQEGAAIYHSDGGPYLAEYCSGRITLLQPGIEHIRNAEDEARENGREADTLAYYIEQDNEQT